MDSKSKAVTAVDRVLNHLPLYGLELNELIGEKMKTHTQVSTTYYALSIRY